ncbi:L,D-transpeptidase [Streptomyces sp. TR06-5]|uniref:L,D-transpeptidase n=1 Tax=unclassified Streptomyces TaxID=2593676 RepID=UPI0039A27B29
MLNRGAAAAQGRPRLVGGGAVGLVVLLVVTVLVVTSFGGGNPSSAVGDGGPGAGAGAGSTGPSRAELSITPRDGAEDVATNGAPAVRVKRGMLSEVTVRTAGGQEVPGAVVEDGTAWKPSRHLATGTKYVVHAVARDAEGREAAADTSFTTLVPDDTFVGFFQPEDGDTVGVGMPVSIRFNRAVEHREDVERAISVTAEPAVDVRGHWFGDQRLDFRPEDYWEPGTEVTLGLDLDGVEGADGVYGSQHRSVTFTVGRSQVSVVDAAKRTMTVTRDGETLRTVPISSGAPATPTYNGVMVISEKHRVTRMNGATVGFTDEDGEGEYDIEDVPHAMRLSTSGTFIHGNYWASSATFGSANTSHGCIGLDDTRGGGDRSTAAAWFYRNSMLGDVVQVRNSRDPETIAPDNGLNGWNMSWEEWTGER